MSRLVTGPATPEGAARFSELANLDFMRAMAVLVVVADHVLETAGVQFGLEFHPWDWYLGRIGVLMFFVHTSLVLMLSMARSRETGAGFFVTFYLRRAFRIYPLAIVCIVLVLAAGVPPMAWQTETPSFSWFDITANLLLIQNLVYSPVVLGPLWSLPLELQMYAVLPPIFLLVCGARPVAAAWRLWALAVVVALAQPLIPGAGRLGVAAFGPCFLAGVLAFVRLGRRAPTLPPVAWAAYLGAVTAVYVGIAQLSTRVHPAWLAWTYCLAIGLAVPHFRHIGPGAVRRWSHWIAKYSYGVYLFHMLALWVGFGPTPLSGPWAALAGLVVLVAAPVATFHLIEQPGINLGTRLAAAVTRRAGRVRAATAPVS
jgi:peptidoglycan/LPS O-acetylase OafA/YrhL